jgi:FAD/FMN-containing dehydrogenase
MDRRSFLTRAAALPLVGGLAACSGSSSPGSSSTATSTAATTTGSTSPPASGPTTLSGLAANLRGPLLTPGEAGYTAASTVANSAYAGVHPQAVAMVRGERDVATCVQYAARTRIPFTARAGGHSYAGYSTNRGLVCNVDRLGGIAVAADGRSVTIGAGVKAIDLITALAARGLAVPTGSCPTVGIAGLSLGGGLGFAARAFGPTCDNILAVRIATADGRVVTADPHTNPDLYWACRGGGGGNFGVVTALTLSTHPVSSSAYGFIDFPWSQAVEAVQAWQQLAPHASPNLYLIAALETGSGTPQARVFGQLLGGTEAQFRAAVASITAVSGASISTGSGPYLNLQLIWAGCSGESASACRKLPVSSFVAKSDYVAKPFPANAVAAMARAIEARQGQSGSGAVIMDPYGAAINKVASDATAFVHRDQLFSCQELAYWSAGGRAAADDWLNGLRAGMRPYVSGQAYQNYIDPTLSDWQTAYYGANLSRLRDVKKRYDPEQVFRFRQSIPPA